jgi:hypothetical protein
VVDPENWFALSVPRNFPASVSTVQEIKSAIDRLPVEERAALVAELCGWADDDWDRQMKADAAAGKFGALNEEASQAYRAGQTKPLGDILRS